MPPTPTVRVTPTAVLPEDGFKTLITFASDPNIEFWEKSVKPPGFDGGDAIDTTTMHNTALRTSAPRSLSTMTDMTATVTYNPVVYDSIRVLVNVKTTVTVRFWDHSTVAFYGFLRTFEPSDASEGTQPEATITVTPTNTDPVTSAEALPVYTAPASGLGQAPMNPPGEELTEGFDESQQVQEQQAPAGAELQPA